LDFQIVKENWQSSIKTALMLKRLHSDDKIDINIAKLYIKNKNYEDANKLLLKLIKNKNYKVYETLGILNYKKQEIIKSIDYFKKALEIEPESFFSNIQLGNILKYKGDYKEAEKYYKISNKIEKNNHISLSNLTSLQISLSENYNKISPLLLEASRVATEEQINKIKIKKGILGYKLRHKYQQACYMNQLYKENKERKKFIEMIEKKDKKELKNEFVFLKPEEEIILTKYMKNKNTYTPKEKISNFINKNIEWDKIEDSYNKSKPKLVVIDDFLEKEALEELRNFSLESSIWHKDYKNKNYIGSIPGDGNYSKIHHGIIKDLKNCLPTLLNKMNFEQMWAFNYDSEMHKGIAAHADFAMVNLNFWITPNQFNLSKNSSGLKIYNKSVPDSWSFDDYNSESNHLINNYLGKEKENFIKIPYKYNRAILFDSSLIHETDELQFTNSYIGRRINYTILFGNRFIN